MSGVDECLFEVDAEIARRSEDLFAFCKDLVEAESINPPGNTADVAGVVATWLGRQGVPVEIVQVDALAPNVVCDIVAERAGRHVVFNAHMDTMPAGDPCLWTAPPLTLTRRDARSYGLGMGNMKGALAAMCLATVVLHKHRDRFAGRLTMTAVSDEVMFGSRGTVTLLDRRPDLKGDFLISGEGPGYMGLAVAEKGLLWLDVEAKGVGGHSSGVCGNDTAAIALARFLTAVDALNGLTGVPPDDLDGISDGDDGAGVRLSINVGMLESGGVRSQVATSARAELDIRLPPGLTTDEVEAMVASCIPDGAEIILKRVKGWDANWTGIQTPLCRTFAHEAQSVRGRSPVPVVRLPGSDARRWRDLGVPALCYGPQPTLSSGIDDHVLDQDLIDCARIYARSALRLMAL